MKQQLTRLSPHQNGKVFAVLMAVGAALLVLPMMVLTVITTPRDQQPPIWLFLLMPFVYLAFTYVAVAAACAVYNRLVPHIGGLEFDTREAPEPLADHPAA